MLMLSNLEIDYSNITQSSRTFYKDLREFRYLRLMRASVSSTPEPMKPESRPSSEQGLESAVNLAGRLIMSSSRHPWLSTPLLTDLL
jgi:hypothetical protein